MLIKIPMLLEKNVYKIESEQSYSMAKSRRGRFLCSRVQGAETHTRNYIFPVHASALSSLFWILSCRNARVLLARLK